MACATSSEKSHDYFFFAAAVPAAAVAANMCNPIFSHVLGDTNGKRYKHSTEETVVCKVSDGARGVLIDWADI